jgi:hypothetical protein
VSFAPSPKRDAPANEHESSADGADGSGTDDSTVYIYFPCAEFVLISLQGNHNEVAAAKPRSSNRNRYIEIDDPPEIDRLEGDRAAQPSVMLLIVLY